MIRYALLVLVLIGAWFVGSPGALAQTSKTGRADFMGREKKLELWHWYRTSGAECIGRHEGGWTSNTGNGFYGRFQANVQFYTGYGRHYGKHISYARRYGSADNWPRVLQIHMALHGYNARGWYPWLYTARICGLL